MAEAVTFECLSKPLLKFMPFKTAQNRSPLILATIVVATLSGCATQTTTASTGGDIYPDPEVYLLGKKLEMVAAQYGAPDKNSAVGNTIFVEYSGSGARGYRFQNICFLALQADKNTGVINNVRVGSNLGMNQTKFPVEVRPDCNRVLLRRALASAP